MAYYAFLNNSNIVTEVIVGIDETELIEGIDPETWYGNFRGQRCVRTSYNNNIRGTYAGIGYSYNEEEDIFISPQPFPSWTRNGSFWESPIPMPTNGQIYRWVEEDLNWQSIPVE
jgi:hypothetical protein